MIPRGLPVISRPHLFEGVADRIFEPLPRAGVALLPASTCIRFDVAPVAGVRAIARQVITVPIRRLDLVVLILLAILRAFEVLAEVVVEFFEATDAGGPGRSSG